MVTNLPFDSTPVYIEYALVVALKICSVGSRIIIAVGVCVYVCGVNDLNKAIALVVYT